MCKLSVGNPQCFLGMLVRVTKQSDFVCAVARFWLQPVIGSTSWSWAMVLSPLTRRRRQFNGVTLRSTARCARRLFEAASSRLLPT
jgi:hypothetical protein